MEVHRDQINRDLRLKSIATAVVTVMLVGWFLFVPFGTETVSTFANILLPLVPVWWCLAPGRAYRGVPYVDERRTTRRWACGLTALGIFCFSVGSTIDYHYTLRGLDPFPSAADFFYFSTYLFLLPGVLLVATRGTSTVARSRLLFDTALTVVALGTFSWYFLLGPILRDGSETLLETVLSAAYPVFDLAILFALLFVSGRIAGGNARWITIPMTLGVVANVAADTLWGYRTLAGTYELGDLCDAGWPAGYLLTGLALRAHLLAPYAPSRTDAATSSDPLSSPLWRSLLPYALLPLVGALVTYDLTGEHDPWIRNGILGGSIVLLSLLLVRQFLSIHENIALNRQLNDTLRALHASHRSLASANAKMLAINRATIAGVMIVDQDWEIQELNAAAERMIGLTSQGATGRQLKELFRFPTDAEELIGKRTEVTARRADGSTLPVELAVVTVDLEGPAIFVAFARDLTAQKEAEAIREDLHQQLLLASRQAGMAEVATGVLHNVGNVLNSVNVSASLVSQKLKSSEVASLKRAADLISEHKDDLGTYITSDQRGRQLPGFLLALTKTLAAEQDLLLGETENLEQGLEHIKQIISSQQSHAKCGLLVQAIVPAALVETALRMHVGSFANHEIQVIREIEALPHLLLDQHKVLQVLVNLISNAKQALKQSVVHPKLLRIEVRRTLVEDAERVQFRVIDNGIGIERDMLQKIFAHGFTTRKNGHGFGLHSAANLAQEMGGSLRAESDGPGRGASFTLDLPAKYATTTTATEI